MKYLIFTLVLVVAQLAHAQQCGWLRVAQIGNQFNNINCVEFKDSLRGWVADGSTGFHYTTNGGVSWQSAPGSTVNVNDISMIDTVTGWAAAGETQRGAIFRTTNGGRSWTQQRYLFDRHYEGTETIRPLENITSGYARNSPDTGRLVTTNNGGVSWTERTIADSIRSLYKMQFLDSLRGWVMMFSSSGPGFLRTTDGGATWLYLRSPSLRAFHFIDSLRGWASAASRSHVYRTTNGGASWEVIADTVGFFDEEFRANAITFIDSSNGWLFGGASFLGDYAVIFRTTDGGYNWVRDHQGGAVDLLDGIMLDRYHGWAVGTGGSVFAYRRLTSVSERINETPKAFSLRQCYPNPFNPSTTIEYEVLTSSHVNLTVYDATGKEVRQLVNADHEAGVYRITFDATAVPAQRVESSTGRQGLASGVYYYTMKTETIKETKQMLLLK